MYQKQLSYYNNDEGAEVFWSSRTAQEKRFEALLDIGDLADKEILDIGCGYADLLKYIEKRDIKIAKYVGIDIVPEIVEKAREQHPEVNISCRNIIENPIEKDSFDYVFGSGIFALGNSEYSQYLISMLTSMLNSARIGVAVNFLKQPINNKVSWKIQSDEFYEFEQILRENNYEYYMEGDTFIINHKGYITFNSLQSLPDNIVFNNNSDINLPSLKSLPDNIVFNNEGSVRFLSLQSLPDNIQFNNGGGVYFNSLKSLPSNIQFNNGDDVELPSLQSLPDNKYDVFKNNGVVYYNDYRDIFNPKVKKTLSSMHIKASQLVKLNPERTLNFIKQHITSKAILKTGYLEDDFTVFLYKE